MTETNAVNRRSRRWIALTAVAAVTVTGAFAIPQGASAVQSVCYTQIKKDKSVAPKGKGLRYRIVCDSDVKAYAIVTSESTITGFSGVSSVTDALGGPVGFAEFQCEGRIGKSRGFSCSAANAASKVPANRYVNGDFEVDRDPCKGKQMKMQLIAATQKGSAVVMTGPQNVHVNCGGKNKSKKKQK